MKLKAREVNILIDVHNGKSISEMAERADLSLAGVHNKLRTMEEMGLINPPPQRGQARSRTLTPEAKEYLTVNGYLNDRVAS